MLEAIKTIMTVRELLSGYKTYLAAFFVAAAAFAGWGTEVFIPYLDGASSFLVMLQKSGVYFQQIAAAFAAAGLRVAIGQTPGASK